MIEAFYVERDMLVPINDERILSEVPPLQEHPQVRHEYSEQLRDWLRRDDPDELWDPPEAADERARAVRGFGVEVVHDRLACFDLDLGDMGDPDVAVPRGLTAAMVESLFEGPSFAAPLRDPTATHVGLVVVHQSIATDPISWTTWVGALLVHA